MKKGKVVFAICTLVIAVIIGMFACFSNVVNASEENFKNNETKVVNTENNSSKKERKGKKEALTDEEKEAKKAERKSKFENLTDEEKAELKEKRKANKEEKKTRKNEVTNMQNAE